MTIIEIAYNLANIIVGIAFIPQIVTLVRHNSAEDRSLNLLTCLMFTLCSISMLGYGLTEMRDPAFLASGFINVTGWALILGLATFNRYVRKPARVKSDDFMVGL